MKRPFKIKSPSGKTIEVTAETIYEACERARTKEGFLYGNSDYLKLNKGAKK